MPNTRFILFLLVTSITAQAGILTFSNQSLFQSQGVIVHNTNWDSYTAQFTPMPNPYSIGGVTYTSGDNLLVGPSASYRNPRPVLAYNPWSPLPGIIDSSPETYDMFGFSIGLVGRIALVDIEISTNLATYTLTDLSVPHVSAGLGFQGFVTDNRAEYFTGFVLMSHLGTRGGSAPAITDVQLGHSVPEPATAVLLACGLFTIAFRRHLRRITS